MSSKVETLTLGTIDVFFWWRAMTRYRRQHIRVAFIRSKLHQFENFMSFFSIHELTTFKVMNTDGQHSFHPCFNDYKVLIEGKGERMSDTIHQDKRGIEAIHTIQYLTYLFSLPLQLEIGIIWVLYVRRRVNRYSPIVKTISEYFLGRYI